MAYLKPTTLTCPTCDFSAEIKIVVGIGAGSNRADTPFEHFKSAPPFTEGAEGTLLCPRDGTVVWTNIAGKKAPE
jgi:hypothetical protein